MTSPKLPLNTLWDGLNAARQDYEQSWRLVDDTLYALCRQYPTHTSRAAVMAKVAIIGRTYQTGLEHQVRKDKKSDIALDIAAKYILDHGSQLDRHIDQLRSLHEPLHADAFAQIADIHGEFTQLLQRIMRGTKDKEHAPRSFASKYLHFHNPVVPIYDALTSGVMATLTPPHTNLTPLPLTPQSDEWYGWYARRFRHLYLEGQDMGIPPTVRLLDHVLLSLALKRSEGIAAEAPTAHR